MSTSWPSGSASWDAASLQLPVAGESSSFFAAEEPHQVQRRAHSVAFPLPRHFVAASPRPPHSTPYPSSDTSRSETFSATTIDFGTQGRAFSRETVQHGGYGSRASSLQPQDSASQIASRYPAFTRTETSGQSEIIVALAEGRGIAHGEIGLATIDLRTSVVTLGQFADSASYMKTLIKLNILQPSAVIISETMASVQSPSTIYNILREISGRGGPNIITVQRKYYNEEKGLEYVKRLNLSSDAKMNGELAPKYYCLSSFAALVEYVGYEHKIVLASNSLKLKYMRLEDTCLIDGSTARNLEILSNAQDAQLVKNCLLGVLDHTKTYAGGRLLRANFLQPFTKQETIDGRLDSIAELIGTEEMFFSLQRILGQFVDIERVISFLVQVPKRETVKLSESHIGSFIQLKHVLGQVEPLRECLKDSRTQLFRGYYELLLDGRYAEMRDLVDLLVHPDVKYEKGSLRMKTQKCYAIKPRINGCIDVARLLYSESVDDISALITSLSEKYNLPLQMGYEVQRGFFIQLYTGGKNPVDVSRLPPEFIHVTKNRSSLCFTTRELVLLNGRSLECLREVFVLSHEMLKATCEALRPLIGCLYELTECVANIDVLVSLTHACSLGDYVRPVFEGFTLIKGSRHPILDRILPQSPVPNDCYVDEGCSFIVIGGPNMGGKTTYIKQMAMLQIMAQIGSHVPAVFASFQIYQQIFSRFGSGDDIQSNASTFMMEMNDMYHICSMANEKTLVLVDELGRGTSPEEGVGICWVLCEKLLLSGATTLFVTHFDEICDLQHLYPNVHNQHFKAVAVENEGTEVEKLICTHELLDGPGLDICYGIALAQTTALPAEIIRNAKGMLNRIRKIKFTMGEKETAFRKQQVTCAFASQVVQLIHNRNMQYNDIVATLLDIRTQYVTEISTLQAEETSEKGDGVPDVARASPQNEREIAPENADTAEVPRESSQSVPEIVLHVEEVVVPES